MKLTGIPLDTSLEALRVQSEIFAKMSGERRLELMFQLNHQADAICEAGIRSRHPEYSDNEVKLARIRLCLGDKLFRQAYPGVEIEP